MGIHAEERGGWGAVVAQSKVSKPEWGVVKETAQQGVSETAQVRESIAIGSGQQTWFQSLIWMREMPAWWDRGLVLKELSEPN